MTEISFKLKFTNLLNWFKTESESESTKTVRLKQ